MKSLFYLTKEELEERGLTREELEDIFETEDIPEGTVPFDTNLVQDLKILYYDIEQRSIRSFTSGNLISWELEVEEDG